MEQTQMTQSQLKIETLENQTLEQAMQKKSALTQAMEKKIDTELLLAYSPTRCAFANWDGKDKKIVSLGGEDIADAYEVRAFGENFEVRWLKDVSDGSGRVAILHDGEGDEYHCLSGQYLLWGTADSVIDNTVALCESRLGKVIVPKPSGLIKTGSRIALLFKEYFKPDKYGNLVFAAERLTGLAAL
jgi:CRISPR-associated protein (TIGR03984 family)